MYASGGYYVFEEELAEMQEERSKVIKRASLLLQYQLKQADSIFQETLRMVDEETEVTFVYHSNDVAYQVFPSRERSKN